MENNINKVSEVELTAIVEKLKNLTSFLKSKLLVIGIVTAITGTSGLIYSLISKPIFTAEMTFAIEKETTSSLGSYSSIAAQFGIDIGGTSGAFEGDNLIELLKSNNIIRKTLLAKNPFSNDLMIELYIENNGIKKKLIKNDYTKKIDFKQSLSTPHRLEDSVLIAVYKRIIKKQLSVDRIDKKLNYVQISMKDKDENFAKNFVELITQNAIDYYTEYKSKKSKENLTLITQKVDSVRNILYSSMQSINQTTDKQLFNVVRQTPKFDNQKNQANIQAHTALYGELLKQLGLAQITAQKEIPLIQIIDRPRFPLENNKISKVLITIIFGFIGFLFTIIFLLIKKQFLTTSS